jgi:hypothetical protein
MSRQRSLIFWPIPLRKDREHSWKHHCRSGLTRELLGWIDVMASKKEAETGVRFVFAKRSTILTRCFKGKRAQGKHYTMRQLTRSFAELREQHIISNYRDTPDGYSIFVVAPHDSLCRGDGKTCLLVDRSAWREVGPWAPPEFKAQPHWTEKVKEALKTSLKKSRSGPSISPSDVPQNVAAMSLKMSLTDAIDVPENVPQNVSDQDLYLSNLALLTDQEKADWLATGMQDGASTRSTRLVESSDEPKKPKSLSSQDALKRHEEFLKKHAEKQKQGQTQDQDQKRERAGFSSLKDDKTDEEQRQKQEPHPSVSPASGSISVHFANCDDIIGKLTDGALDQSDYRCTDGFQDWSLLSGCALAAIDAKKDRQYLGLSTNAALMRDTMTRLKKQHNLNAPESWLPIMDAMQGRTPEMKVEKARKKAVDKATSEREKESVERLDKLKAEMAVRFEAEDWQPCQVWSEREKAMVVINYSRESRIKFGLTVLAACTVSGERSLGQHGKPVWHKAQEPKAK